MLDLAIRCVQEEAAVAAHAQLVLFHDGYGEPDTRTGLRPICPIGGPSPRERLPRPYWPVRPAPESDEWLPSWVVRLAEGLGVRPADLLLSARVREDALGHVRCRAEECSAVAHHLAAHTGLTAAHVSALSLGPLRDVMAAQAVEPGALGWPQRQEGAGWYRHRWPWIPWAMPPRARFRDGSRMFPRPRRTTAIWAYAPGAQYCPACLASDPVPHLRRIWQAPFVTLCPTHGAVLLDGCPACGKAVQLFDGWPRRLRPRTGSRITRCHRCGVERTGGAAAGPAGIGRAAASGEVVSTTVWLMDVVLRGWVAATVGDTCVPIPAGWLFGALAATLRELMTREVAWRAAAGDGPAPLVLAYEDADTVTDPRTGAFSWVLSPQARGQLLVAAAACLGSEVTGEAVRAWGWTPRAFSGAARAWAADLAYDAMDTGRYKPPDPADRIGSDPGAVYADWPAAWQESVSADGARTQYAMRFAVA